jgi:hypothetical protein
MIHRTLAAVLALALAASGQVLHDNGPPANSLGTGVGGADESILQTSLGNMMIGAQCDVMGNSRVLDDFVITDPSGWQVDTIVVHCYQPNGTLPSTITEVRLQIWAGDPGAGGTLVFGDLATNRLAATTWSNAYRVHEAASGTSTERPIMTNTVTVGTTLGPGTYWLEFQAAGSLPVQPFAQPLVITGQADTGNAKRIIFGGPLIVMIDHGHPLGLPFRVEGSVAGITKFCTAKAGLACGTPAIAASGTPSASSGSGFVVSAAPARSCRSGILVYNTGQIAGVPFQGGTLCVEPMGLRRAGSTSSMGTPGGASCDGAFAIDMNTFAVGAWVVPNCDGSPSATPPNNPAPFLTVPGTAVFAAYWGRDSVATGSFVSDGVGWSVGP